MTIAKRGEAISLRCRSALSWILQSLGVLLTQGAINLGFFLTNLLLIRNVAPAEFGTFAMVLGAILIAYNVHGSFVTYPLTLRASDLDSELPQLVGANIVTSLIISVPIAAVIGGICFFVLSPMLAAGVAAATLAWFGQAVTRKALLARLRFAQAAVGDIVCHLGLPLTLFWYSLYHPLSLYLPFFVFTVTASIAAVLQARQCGVELTNLRYDPELARTFFRIGPKVAVSAVGEVVLSQSVLWTLFIAYGKAAVGTYAAMVSLLGASHPILFSIATLMVPVVARYAPHAGRRMAAIQGISMAAPLALCALAFFAVIVTWAPEIITLVYGAERGYDAYSGVLRLLTIGYTALLVSEIVSGLLLGFGRVNAYATAHLAGMAACIGVGLPMVAIFGHFGASLVGAVTAATRIAVALPMLARVLRDRV